MKKNLEKNERCTDYTIHYCIAPLRDGIRIWIGDDPSKYVDRHLLGIPSEVDYAIAEWFRRYGDFAEEGWEECFPETARKMYLREICEQGYSQKEAEEIMRYLPQTDSEYMFINVPEMIRLWEEKAPKEIAAASKAKVLITEGGKNLWTEDIYSPKAIQAREQGRLEALAEMNAALETEENHSE